MTRRRGLWISGIASAVLFLVLAVVDARIQDSGGPGIVPFELAWSTDRATEILGQWGQSGRDAARLSLWIDYLYLIAYAAFLSLAVLAVRDAAQRRGWARYARPGTAIAVLPVVAAVCDAIEDAALLLVVGGHADSPAPALATAFALVKFAALAVALVYLLGGLIAMAAKRSPHPQHQ
jgi:hypothetical protein